MVISTHIENIFLTIVNILMAMIVTLIPIASDFLKLHWWQWWLYPSTPIVNKIFTIANLFFTILNIFLAKVIFILILGNNFCKYIDGDDDDILTNCKQFQFHNLKKIMIVNKLAGMMGISAPIFYILLSQDIFHDCKYTYICIYTMRT